MKILFVHQNFPGQFPHLAPALAGRGHQVLALTDQGNERPSPVPVVRYKTPGPVAADTGLGRAYARHMGRAHMAARAARALRDRHGYAPDLILGHTGWGETLLLREIWPDARLLAYAELLYRTRGHDVGFDPEIAPATDEARFLAVGRSAHLIQGIVQADAAICPTHYQAGSFPPELRGKITVIHDGIDTGRVAPDPGAVLALPDGTILTPGDPVVSFVSRSLEPYRGIHIFLRALPAVLAARPDARVVIVGGDGVSYGAPPPGGDTWTGRLRAELGPALDPARVHFLGRVPYAAYLSLLQITAVHAYLTYPFVLSWSLAEAMAAGALIVASDTEPVRELIEHDRNGRLVPFHDPAALAAALVLALAGGPGTARLRAAARATILDGYDLHGRCLPAQIAWVESHTPLR